MYVIILIIKKNGIYQEWFDNDNKILECTYVDDKLQGQYKEWSIHGILIKDTFYIDDIDDNVDNYYN